MKRPVLVFILLISTFVESSNSQCTMGLQNIINFYLCRASSSHTALEVYRLIIIPTYVDVV